MKLFCLPYAGGSARVIYNSWQQYLPANIKVVPLELAGHGTRMPERFHDSIEAAVMDMLNEIRDSILLSPYAIFGHSMGSLLAYELVKAIATAGLPPPEALFVSGRKPPHCYKNHRNIHLYSDQLLLNEMKKLGGTALGFFENQELVNAFLPMFRSDYRMIERHKVLAPVHSTTADVVFLYSNQDNLVNGPEIEDWKIYTKGSFTKMEFSGGHFFINEHRNAICNIIGNTLKHSTV